ncbi:MAG: serine/threonine protein kinase, partial [Bdellovibrionales bacterium]|nr:serine/threonine protein kinase [Bdellovibrionales bacterium]
MDGTNQETAGLIAHGVKVADRYEVLRTIGAGGMGAVYLVADHERDGKRMAMKVMHAQISTDKSYVSRFIREMELMEQIEHPNVVKVFDFGTFGSIIYFTMEYVDFPSLEHLLDTGTFKSKLIPHLIIGIADALEAIHAKDIIHRDLKPGNILISDEGQVKITDFGVARPLVSDLTMQNQKVGSIAYMAPEIWLAKQLTPAVDYYSLGVMLYEVVTGELPYPETDDLVEMMKMHTKRSIPAPNALASNIPGWLNKLIMRLLSKNPKSRMKYAEKLIEDIRDRFPKTDSEFISPYDTNELGLV